MAKSRRLNGQQVVTSLVAGIVIGLCLTAASNAFSHTTVRQHCSQNPKIDSVIDCSLKTKNHGLPLPYNVEDIPQNDFKTDVFLIDWAIWSAASTILIVKVRKYTR